MYTYSDLEEILRLFVDKKSYYESQPEPEPEISKLLQLENNWNNLEDDQKTYLNCTGVVTWNDLEGGYWEITSINNVLSSSNTITKFVPINIQDNLSNYEGQRLHFIGTISTNIVSFYWTDIANITDFNNLKILCLHGGGGSGTEMSDSMEDFINKSNLVSSNSTYICYNGKSNIEFNNNENYDLSDFLFYFPSSQRQDGNWWVPIDKDNPPANTQLVDFPVSYDTITNNNIIPFLTEFINEHGPFQSIMGYSQGCPAAMVLLAYKANEFDFDKLVTFCGYPPYTYQGMMNKIEDEIPFSNVNNVLIYSGENDEFIYNHETSWNTWDTEYFTNASTIKKINDPNGYHEPPKKTYQESSFKAVVKFLLNMNVN